MKMEPLERFKVILRLASPSQLATMFAAGDKALLRDVAKRVHLGYQSGTVTEEQATHIVNACLRLRNPEHILKLVFGLTEPVSDTAERLLGDSFIEPTQNDLDALTPKLVRQHGRLLTVLYYARVIAGDNYASPMLEQYFQPDGLFEVRADDSKPIPLSKPKPRAVDPATKELRKQRKIQRKKPVANVKPAVRKRRDKAKPRVEAKLTAKHSTKPESKNVIEQKRLGHPHIRPGNGLSVTHELVGSVVLTYIAYDKTNPAAEGKVRPCVIVAVAPKHLLVRPIYSNPHKFAGHWRSVRLDDWKKAGLMHQSFVGSNFHKVGRTKVQLTGHLTVRDWNKICRGEVNPEGDF
jgi:hypothetical protein